MRLPLALFSLCLPLALGAGGIPAQAQEKPPVVQQKKAPDETQKAATEKKAKPKPKPKPKAKAEPKKKAKPKPAVSKQRQEERYREGLAHEGKGDDQAALTAYLEAGNAGHGQAQKKLGDIYGKGNKAAKRDYDSSLRWYEKARAQGVEIPKPHAFTKGR